MGKQIHFWQFRSQAWVRSIWPLLLSVWLALSWQVTLAGDGIDAGASFSFAALKAAPKMALPPVEHLQASDGLQLAYRAYVPSQAKGVLVFYHGGGAHGAAGYGYLGMALSQHFSVVVLTPDMRGHGESDGPRGDTPTPNQAWDDVGSMLQLARSRWPGLPLFLGGHSSGAGLVLNYVDYAQPAALAGLVFLAPEFGSFAATHRKGEYPPFASVTTSHFFVSALTGGWLSGHSPTVKFNYPPSVLAQDPKIVTTYTVMMANAVTPANPMSQLARLNVPFGLWIGADDELLDPELVLKLANTAQGVLDKQMNVISGANHLSVLLSADGDVGRWLAAHVSTTPVNTN